MAYIHYLEIAHRDMKLENIVLTSGPGGRVVAKIADFGFSHSALEHTRDDVRCGSPDYAGPEIIINCQDSMFPSDIWALGIIIYSIYEVRWPYVEKNLKQKLVGHQTLDSMTWKDELDIPYVVMSRDAPFQFLINSMLRMLPETRPKAVHIAGDYFFTRMSSQTAPVASSF
jgi:serine/threonine protein kinase